VIQKSNKIHVSVGPDKESIQSRVDRATVIGKLAPQSPLYQATPSLQTSGTVLLKAGGDLKAREDQVNTARLQLEAAQEALAAQIAAYDVAYGLFVANVETYATSPGDATALGTVLLDKTVRVLAPPLAVDARYDAVKELLRIHVTRAAGMRATRIEISTDPSNPASWKDLPGYGARVALSGYAPGVYWVRAASMIAGDRSAYTGPVMVVVK
jgi:hypothetical protein